MSNRNENTTLWDSLKVTDPKFTKDFVKSGGFKGTAISPMYYAKRLTEEFGPVGKGWGFVESDQKIVDLQSRMIVYIQGKVWWKNPDSDEVYYTPSAWGGDFIVSMNSKGPVFDDDAFKKASTDAFSKAVTYLGLGADVHLGFFDDNKYVETAQRYTAKRAAMKKESAAQAQQSQEVATQNQAAQETEQQTAEAESNTAAEQAEPAVSKVHSVLPPLGQVRARIRKTRLESLDRLWQWASENYSEADMKVIESDIISRKQALSA